MKRVHQPQLADDIKMFREISKNNDVLGTKLDIARMADWCRQSKLDSNIDKCFVIL